MSREDFVLEITCPDCHRAVDADDVNINNLIGKCSNCDSVFSIADQLGGLISDNQPSGFASVERPPIAKPDKVTIDNNGVTLSINYSWSNTATKIFLTFFCAFWDIFMIVWFAIAISSEEWAMAAFGIIHGLVGVGITYTCVAMWVNSTFIRVDATEINIRHEPLPWPGAMSLNPSELEQLYTVESVSSSRNSSSVSYSYELHGHLKKGQRRKLVSGLDNVDQCLYLEQQIEDFLGIEDRPERGEVSRA